MLKDKVKQFVENYFGNKTESELRQFCASSFNGEWGDDWAVFGYEERKSVSDRIENAIKSILYDLEIDGALAVKIINYYNDEEYIIAKGDDSYVN